MLRTFGEDMRKGSNAPVTARLRDGTRVVARPVQPEDRERLRQGFERLSKQSRYWRFHAAIQRLSEEQLTYFTHVDHVDHEAWLLLDLDHPESPGVGIARYVRDPEDPSVAEAAITVADEYQGLGGGTLLLGLLAERARANGIRVFRNYVMPDNTAMLDLFRQLGGIVHDRTCNDAVVVDLPLPKEAEHLLDSPVRRALAAVARTRDLLEWLVPPAWDPRQLRRRGDRADQASDASASPDFDLRRELTRFRQEVAQWLGSDRRR